MLGCLVLTQGILGQEVPTPKIDSLATLYREYLNTQPERAQKAATQWLKLAQTKQLSLQEARAHYALGNLGNITGDYKSTVFHAQQTIKLLTKNKVEDGLAACYNLLALGYKNLGDYPKAMDGFVKCLSYAEAQNDEQQEANAYQNIATLYVLQNDYIKASESLDRAAHLYRELKDDDGVLTTLFNFANILKENDIILQIKDPHHIYREASLKFFIYNILPGTTPAATIKAASAIRGESNPADAKNL